jgi:putative GTP pyrophosphokinase
MGPAIMARTPKTTQHKEWLIGALPKHERLSAAVHSLLENIIKKKRVDYLGVSHRTKTLDGALEKIHRKEYGIPKTQLTDLSGIRVITFLEEQVREISKITKDLFEIDEKNSLDRTEFLGDDKVGYRSTHFVCRLGAQRGALPEYDGLGPLTFEIQIRTVLQHAWAELAHDRSFKFGTTLPTKIQRKLNLYSGMLEIVDGGFDEISKEIDSYKTAIERRPLSEIFDVEITSISVSKIMGDIERQYKVKFLDKEVSNFEIEEISACGISNIGELQALLPETIIRSYFKASNSPNVRGLIRLGVGYKDIEKLLSSAKLTSISPAMFKVLASKYGAKRLSGLLKKRDIGMGSFDTALVKRTRPRRRSKRKGS